MILSRVVALFFIECVGAAASLCVCVRVCVWSRVTLIYVNISIRVLIKTSLLIYKIMC
jgi:hypothetical protein